MTPANSTISLDGKFTIAMIDPAAVGADESGGQTRHWLVNGATISGMILGLCRYLATHITHRRNRFHRFRYSDYRVRRPRPSLWHRTPSVCPSVSGFGPVAEPRVPVSVIPSLSTLSLTASLRPLTSRPQMSVSRRSTSPLM